MKRLLLLLIGFQFILLSQGQTLVQAEYFFDTDPGFGLATPITFSPTDSLSLDSLIINGAGLTLGYHYLYVRTKNADGIWGHTNWMRVYVYEEFSNSNTGVSAPLVGGEYFFDQDTVGPGGGAYFTFPQSDTITESILANTPNLSLGQHQLYARVKDSLGNWSFPYSITFDICSTYNPISGFDYIQYGYKYSFIDTSQYSDSYYWDYGDGFSDSVSNPSHTYNSPGVYQVKQKVNNTCGVDSTTNTIILGGIESYFPKVSGDTGWVTISFYGGFQDVDSISVKLSRIGEADIFAPDSFITVVDNSLIQASFLLDYETHGFWDISLNLVNDTTYIIQNGLEIEGVKLDYHVEVLAPANGFRFARDNQVFLTFTNLSNVNLQYPHISLFSHNTDYIGLSKDALDDSLLALNMVFFDSTKNDNGFISPNQILTSQFFTRTTLSGVSLGVATPGPEALFEKAKETACKIWSGGVCNCVPDNIGPLSFSSACDRHDRCYGCFGAKKQDCDREFFFDLIKECLKNPGLYGPCFVTATAYYGGVHFKGQEYYDSAQAAMSFESCDPPPPPAPMNIDGPCIPIPPGFGCKEIAGSGAIDPNDKFGNQGYGPERYIKEKSLSYGIRFENVDSATASAAIVLIKDTLDKNVYDLNSFSLGTFIIGDSIYSIPPNRKKYTVDIDFANSLNLILRLNAYLNDSTGLITWKFLSLDPISMEVISDLRGFLPPNVVSPKGEGMVTYTISLKNGLPHDTEVKNRASIIFDSNAPIITNYWSNKLDLIPPISSVASLPLNIANTTLIDDSLLVVSWGGSDQGAGIIYYDVYLSIGSDTSFSKWQSLTTETFDTLAVKPGESYRFYSIAYDGVGNIEEKEETVEAITTIITSLDDEDFLNKVKIYPNPGDNLIDFEANLPNQKSLEVKILTLMGQEINSFIFYPNSENKIIEQIDIGSYPSGVYLIRLSGDNGVEVTKKLIKR